MERSCDVAFSVEPSHSPEGDLDAVGVILSATTSVRSFGAVPSVIGTGQAHVLEPARHQLDQRLRVRATTSRLIAGGEQRGARRSMIGSRSLSSPAWALAHETDRIRNPPAGMMPDHGALRDDIEAVEAIRLWIA